MADHDELTRRIAAAIMTGDGETAVRLDLVDDTGCTFGAWTPRPLADLISRHLRESTSDRKSLRPEQVERARRLMVAWDGGREYDEQKDDVWFGDVIDLLREVVGDE